MNSKELGEDVAFFLYLVPVIAGIVYFAYEWYSISHSSPSTVSLAYLIVSKDPYLFILSVVAICVAIVAEVRTAEPASRESIIQSNSYRLLVLAVVVLIASFIGAYSVSGNDFGIAATFFVAGREVFLFAFLLVLISIFLNPKEVYGNAKLGSLPEVIGLVLLVASPAIFYVGLKAHISFAASSIVGLIVFVLGLVLLSGPRLARKRQEIPAKTA